MYTALFLDVSFPQGMELWLQQMKFMKRLLYLI